VPKATNVSDFYWHGDFYIGVRGGSGDYTISDSEHCHWDINQQKFVCRYSGVINTAMMRTLIVSCPGCKPIEVALSGKGVTSRETGPGICRVPDEVVQLTVEPTRTPPPAPPGQPVAPLYPKSPIQPWDKDAFVRAVGASRDTTKAFLADFTEIAAGKLGDCSYYMWKFYSQWEAQPGFTDVPAEWYAQYYSYRTTLENLRVTVEPISNLCLKGGGKISEDIDKTILAGVDSVVKRLEALYAEVQAK
jgi:hypothetical protein